MSNSVESLFASIRELHRKFESELPPVDDWKPELNGDLEMRIDREGHWYYQGSRIERPTMVKLFSSILKKEGGHYYLVTPVEKWRISVDVAPFVFVSMTVKEDAGQPGVVLTTQTGLDVLLSDKNPFWMADINGHTLPMARVYRNIEGLVGRNVYYALADHGTQITRDDGSEELVFESAGKYFSLGSF